MDHDVKPGVPETGPTSQPTKPSRPSYKQLQIREDALRTENSALLRRESLLRTIVDHVPDRVEYWYEDGTCGFANRAYCAWVGRASDEIVGQSLRTIIGEGRASQVQAEVSAALAGQAQDSQAQVENADGSFSTARVRYLPDLSDNTVLGYVAVSSDVSVDEHGSGKTPSHRALTKARDQAQAATRAKAAFLANMSHEIRTPMNAIIGLTRLILGETQEASTLDRVEKVAGAANHLLSVINNVLDLSKIDSGKLTLEAVDFRLDSMLSHVASLVVNEARAKGIELVTNPDHLPHVLHGDVTRISQALLNILSNAVKFTSRGSVSLLCQIVEERPDSLLIRFEVRDTGIGIRPDRIEGLFSAFEQADASTTRRFGGTGLGLSITRELARLMGGEAGAQSEPGTGSTFWFTARLARSTAAPAATHIIHPTGARALVVDDLPEARRALTEMLRELGIRSDSVSSGRDALTYADRADAANDPYTVCLLDWSLPDGEGALTWSKLKAARRRVPLRAILVTAEDSDRSWGVAREAGLHAVLVKPASSRSLQFALDEAASETYPVIRPATSAIAQPGELAALRSTQTGARVLLVDDNLVNLEVAGQLLHNAGLEVDIAADGSEAVEKARSGQYDLVLMDVHMPNMDGLTATHKLREMPATRGLPIIAMTASVFDDDRAACLAAGMNDHIGKPLDLAAMYAAVLRWLPQRRLGFAPQGVKVVAPSAAAAPRDSRSREEQINAFARVQGLEPEVGLLLFDGDMNFYVSVLSTFAQVYQNGMPSIDLSIAEAPAVELAAHSLRSASGYIGANAVARQAAALEALCSEGHDAARLAAAASELQRDLVRFVRQLSVALVGPLLPST